MRALGHRLLNIYPDNKNADIWLVTSDVLNSSDMHTNTPLLLTHRNHPWNLAPKLCFVAEWPRHEWFKHARSSRDRRNGFYAECAPYFSVGQNTLHYAPVMDYCETACETWIIPHPCCNGREAIFSQWAGTAATCTISETRNRLKFPSDLRLKLIWKGFWGRISLTWVHSWKKPRNETSYTRGVRQ